jgi:hypothetical protein
MDTSKCNVSNGNKSAMEVIVGVIIEIITRGVITQIVGVRPIVLEAEMQPRITFIIEATREEITEAPLVVTRQSDLIIIIIIIISMVILISGKIKAKILKVISMVIIITIKITTKRKWT